MLSDHFEKYIDYVTSDGTKWQSTWVGNGFHHVSLQSSVIRDSNILVYKTWDHTNWTANWDAGTGKFNHTPSDGGSAHEDIILNYISTDGTKWTTLRDGDGFYHIYIAAADDTDSGLLGKIVKVMTQAKKILDVAIPLVKIVAGS